MHQFLRMKQKAPKKKAQKLQTHSQQIALIKSIEKAAKRKSTKKHKIANIFVNMYASGEKKPCVISFQISCLFCDSFVLCCFISDFVFSCAIFNPIMCFCWSFLVLFLVNQQRKKIQLEKNEAEKASTRKNTRK